SSSRDAQKVDVLIGGAGFAGLALAIALRQSLAPSFSVTVADPALAGAAKDGRASAIVAAARRLFETIGVWEDVEAQPILDMVVTNSRLTDAVRPVFLSFDGDVEPGEPFAQMVENGPLLAALAAKAKDEGVTLAPAAVTDLEFAADRATDRTNVRLSNGDALAARLVVAADGARSAIRARAGIASHGWSSSQSAIVPTVPPHHGRARARSPRPRRGAFSPGRAIRDPAADAQSRGGPPFVDRVDRRGARGGAHRRAARGGISRRARAALRSPSRRDRGGRPAPRPSARSFGGARVHRRSARAGGRRRPWHPSDRGAGAPYWAQRPGRPGPPSRRFPP